ncbi:diguanylate cyclase [candidate division WOR-3 bacterium]|uniref:Diguanylate cyclase n=1 Tax=candidate division WOR-3 bacterium TaxID=2052148 RepID=A0A660SNQ4_UNCW3|nr:MAG: diguanylate cyclase [candidate division WOR-3 bacterium]
MSRRKERLEDLVDIGIALSSERKMERLLELIVTEARKFTGADAGSLYIKEGDKIRFSVSQNETLERKLGREAARAEFVPFLMPISNESIAGYVANTGNILDIKDVYHLPKNVEYKFNRSWDEKTGYRCKSMLVVPMRDREGEVIGVLQLINALDKKGRIRSFRKRDVKLVLALASQAAVAVKNAKLTEAIRQQSYDTIFRLSTVAEFRDIETGHHIKRISLYSAVLAQKLGLDENRVETIRLASAMHDVGKIGIPDSILLKPGRLTPEERRIMETHTLIGARILGGSDSELLKVSEKVALTHHERYDGLGYPNRLKGEEIPLEGRIVALSDVFDALSNRRVYKPAFSMDKVVEIVNQERGKHFDPKVVDAFHRGFDEIMQIFEEYKEV